MNPSFSVSLSSLSPDQYTSLCFLPQGLPETALCQCLQDLPLAIGSEHFSNFIWWDLLKEYAAVIFPNFQVAFLNSHLPGGSSKVCFSDSPPRLTSKFGVPQGSGLISASSLSSTHSCLMISSVTLALDIIHLLAFSPLAHTFPLSSRHISNLPTGNLYLEVTKTS